MPSDVKLWDEIDPECGIMRDNKGRVPVLEVERVIITEVFNGDVEAYVRHMYPDAAEEQIAYRINLVKEMQQYRMQ